MQDSAPSISVVSRGRDVVPNFTQISSGVWNDILKQNILKDIIGRCSGKDHRDFHCELKMSS